jgi:hypothetical protein
MDFVDEDGVVAGEEFGVFMSQDLHSCNNRDATNEHMFIILIVR